ncbi:hypothetical protein DB459_00665 [Bradyrhizobium sp. WD16]|nr:hypothetical protein DB459_00665 [Bradyrhizobium sp. WD16]
MVLLMKDILQLLFRCVAPARKMGRSRLYPNYINFQKSQTPALTGVMFPAGWRHRVENRRETGHLPLKIESVPRSNL